MKLPEKKQQVILATITALLISFVLFGYIPLANAKKALRVEKTSYSNEHVKVSGQVELLPVISEQKNELENYVGDFGSKVPESRQFAALWEQITATMKAHGLGEQLIQPGTQVEGKELICIPLSIECVGKPNQVFALLRSLESFERLIRFDSLELEKTDISGIEIRIKAGAKVYYRKAGQP